MIVDGRRGPDALDLDRVVAHLPWPNVRGKRCLDLGSLEGIDAELERRGAAEVVVVDASRDLEPDIEPFDIAVGVDVLTVVGDAAATLAAVRRATRGMFLSSEPIDLWRSVLGRGNPWLALDGDGRASTFNGAGHKQLLTDAGFAIERASRPYTARSPESPTPARTWRTTVDTLGMRAVTGSWTPGLLHRALLARPTV